MKFIHKDSSQLAEEQIVEAGKSLQTYVQRLNDLKAAGGYAEAEGSINLAADEALLESVLLLSKQKATEKLRYIIDIGIGGSNLGTKAVYDALYGAYDVVEPQRFPKMIFLDTVDEGTLHKVTQLITTLHDKEEVLVNAISKSGSTTETISNLEVVTGALKEKFGDIWDRVVITTDDNSNFMQEAQKKGISTLSVPKLIGGRYSVLSAVGLFPLACCGIDVKALRNGALSIREACLKMCVDENPAMLSAIFLYLHNKEGRNINDNFFFQPSMESLGKWYRQLMGESIGKEHNLQGEAVRVGITPTVSIGSTDLHSVAQLYYGGPADKCTTFVWIEHSKNETKVPHEVDFPLVSHIADKKIYSIIEAIRQGVMISYKNHKMPFVEVVLDSVQEEELGAYLQFKMMEMMFLAQLFNVNAFDQPHVEVYKAEMKKILANN